MNQEEILCYWDTYIYEQQENYRDDVDLLLQWLGDKPQRVFEVACGGGRILVPLAKAGHQADGIDADPYMLARLALLAEGLPNISWRQGDATAGDWGEDYDAIVLGGNILINILSDMPTMDAQRLFLQKAASCVKAGGHMYLDFNCPPIANIPWQEQKEWLCFDGTDDHGTYGKYFVCGDTTDGVSRNIVGHGRFEITPKDGETFVVEVATPNHFPTIPQVRGWLKEFGWEIEIIYGNRQGGPVDESEEKGVSAIIWARKA